jgi:hypothetical protein
MLYRESQGNITVVVNGVSLPTSSWATLAGGDAAAGSNKTRPGGMGKGVELGGQVVRTDATVTRQWSDALIAVYYDLDGSAGNTVASVSFTPLNLNKSMSGQPSFTWTGILLTVTPPPVSAESDTAAFLSIVIGLNEDMATHQN